MVMSLCCMLLVAGMACVPRPQDAGTVEMRKFEAFFRQNMDSVSIAPRKKRLEALRQMAETTDSLVRYCYLSFVSKTCLATSDLDSARLLALQIEAFTDRYPFSPRFADLRSECFNMEGNIYSRKGVADSAVICYKKAYEMRLQGAAPTVIPDILMNLADAYNHLGKLDTGAFWYRKALLVCDSLNLPPETKFPIYYGLAQGYMTLRDYDQCDHYYNLAAESFDRMLPDEKHFYLNNRGNSYYYRGDYQTAIGYFRQIVAFVKDYPYMTWGLNLSYLNLADCFLQLDETDSAAHYLNLCQPFFQKVGSSTALYYIDTQHIELALQRKDFAKARKLLTESKASSDIEPEMVHIRNKYLQQFCEETGDYKQAYHYLQENNRLDDSVRGDRVKMRIADLTLRYQQDSTLMAHKVLFQKQQNEMLVLRQSRLLMCGVALIAFLIALMVYLYNRKERDLAVARNHRVISSLRLENLRNRLSPHFIFNVLNREMVRRKDADRHELAMLMKLIRRNLELAEQLSVTLAEELGFVTTYLDLESSTLGPDFHLDIRIAEDVYPERVNLPSMLIQIPVENSIKHGLRDKEGNRSLWIAVNRVDSGICIRITDNGGGYRIDSRNKGTGTGMKVIMQTIQILNMKNKENIDVAVHDISLPSGETGCEVTFILPDKYDYTL